MESLSILIKVIASRLKALRIPAKILFICAVLACIAGILAIPGMPKLFHFDKSDGQNPSSLPVTPTQTPFTKVLLPPTSPLTDVSPPTASRRKNKVPAPKTASEVQRQRQPNPASDPQQHCEVGSVCIGRDNNGSVDVHLEKPKPPKRVISDSSAKLADHEISKLPQGLKSTFIILSSSDETADFTNQLMAIFQNRGWIITLNRAAQPSFQYLARDGRGWSWVGKGFVCAGFSAEDPNAVAALKAIRATGYPCEEKQNEPELGVGATTIVLLVGTREKRADDD